MAPRSEFVPVEEQQPCTCGQNYSSKSKFSKPKWSNFKTISIPAGGDSFYAALSFSLYSSVNGSLCLRKLVVNYIVKNWVEFSASLHNQNSIQFQSDHSQPGVFVSTVRIDAASRTLRVPIFL